MQSQNLQKNLPERYFQHFKGGFYKLIFTATHSETLEPYVVYQALYGEKGMWVRPEKMFFEEIERDGRTFKRFRELNASEVERLLADLDNQ